MAGGRHGVLRRVHGAARREHRDRGLPGAAAAVRGPPGSCPVGLAGLPADADGTAHPGGPLVGLGPPPEAGSTWPASSCSRLRRRPAASPRRSASSIALRVVQAAGAAMLQANSVALVVTSVPESSRRAGLGIQAAAQAVGLASGPVTGGLLVSAAGWRWVFFLNVPVGVLAVVAGVYLLPRTRGLATRPGPAFPADAGRRDRGPRGGDLAGWRCSRRRPPAPCWRGLRRGRAELAGRGLWPDAWSARPSPRRPCGVTSCGSHRCWNSGRWPHPGLAGRYAERCARALCCSAAGAGPAGRDRRWRLGHFAGLPPDVAATGFGHAVASDR